MREKSSPLNLAALLCFVILLMPNIADAQIGSQQTPAPTGVRTGGVFAPVRDAKNRPITAGGFVDGAQIVFEDITKRAGLDKFRHVSGTVAKGTILEAPGSGVAL